METRSNKTIVLETYRKIIRDLDLTAIDNYIHKDYIQHSPTVKNGMAGILEMLTFMKSLPKPAVPSPSPILRVIADGDFVAIHLDVKFMGKRTAVVDLMRLKDGKIAEHWDAGQLQSETGDSPVTMTNGISVIEDAVDANESKRLIAEFYKELAIGNTEAVEGYFTVGFVEHNPKSALLNFTREIIVCRIIAEGNFVVSHCECKGANQTFAQFNIFKLEDDKIAEHWSVEQIVPDVMAHDNGMF